MSARLVVYKGNTQKVKLLGLQDQATGNYINNATVVATLKDANGQAVTGLSSLSLSYIAASDGDYQATVDSAFDPTAGTGYTLFLTATSGGSVYHIERPVVVQVRTT